MFNYDRFLFQGTTFYQPNSLRYSFVLIIFNYGRTILSVMDNLYFICKKFDSEGEFGECSAWYNSRPETMRGRSRY